MKSLKQVFHFCDTVQKYDWCHYLQLSCDSYTFVSYRLLDNICFTTNPTAAKFQADDAAALDMKQPLNIKLRKLLQDVEIQSK